MSDNCVLLCIQLVKIYPVIQTLLEKILPIRKLKYGRPYITSQTQLTKKIRCHVCSSVLKRLLMKLIRNIYMQLLLTLLLFTE